jgi:hypothetical protein
VNVNDHHMDGLCVCACVVFIVWHLSAIHLQSDAIMKMKLSDHSYDDKTEYLGILDCGFKAWDLGL